MTKSSRMQQIASGVVGGLVVLVVGTVLIATDVIDTGDTTEVVQEPAISRPGNVPAGGSEKSASTVSGIYKRVSPGVVFVEARVREGASDSSPFGFPEREGGVATGSGFILDDDGFILTNAHVVDGARKKGDIDVKIGEQDSIPAELIGSDLSTDIAVLKIDPKEHKGDLVPLELADSSKVTVGDPVIAIGNPFGFDNTVTTGIVSALQRQITAPNGFSIDNVLQTDASINPGNSGGPLLDANGRVIGINSQIATGGSRGSVGIGFAVPSNTAREVVPQLQEDGEIKRAFLGITTVDVDRRTAEDLNLPVQDGALVQEVVEDGPADKAGIRAGRTRTDTGIVAGGDLIVKVDGVAVKEPQDVADAIADNKPGDTVEVEYYRGDDLRKARVKLAERPRSAQTGRAPGGPGPEGEDDDDGGGLFPLP